MSARSVCRGTRPSRYHSTRAISAPATRPDPLMPMAWAARAVDAEALGAQAHRRLHGALHRAAEGHAALELLGDVLGDELRVDLRLADLDDVEVDLAALGDAGEIGAQLLDVRTLLAD